MIAGQATQSGTAAYAEKHPALSYNTFDDTGLHVSQAGFGGYRVDVSIDSHRQALRHALLNGINLIDTSANYADGGSEKLVGEVVAELLEQGELARHAVVVVSKAGYIQGQNYQLAQRRQAENRPFPDVVNYAEGLDHCIHPEFLEDQLTRSLGRLNMDSLDCYLLHNPEYYLSWAERASIPLDEARREYYRRIELAFRYLEREVERGRIQWYGISSNTFAATNEDAQFTSLETAWAIAAAQGTDHHFRVVQMPMNLLETEAATEKNQSSSLPALDFAREKKLAVLINRPLNAIRDSELTRLADVPAPNYPATAEEVSTAVDTSLRIEASFQRDMLPQLSLAAETERQMLEYLAVGLLLEGRWQGFGTYQNWRDVQYQFVLPRVRSALQFLSNQENLPPEVALWRDQYIEATETTLAAVSAFYQEQGAARAQAIKATAVAADPAWDADTLSQTAVRALRSTAGVTTVLVGMRLQVYVKDVVAELARPVEVKEREASWVALKRGLAIGD